MIEAGVQLKVQVGMSTHQRLRSEYADALLIRVFSGCVMGNQDSIVSSGGKL